MKATMIRSFLLPVFVAALGQLPALGVEPESVKPAEVKVAAVQMLGYDKTDLPRPGFDPSETVVQYIQKAATDGAQLVVFPEYLLGRISVPGPQTERISKAAAAGHIMSSSGAGKSSAATPSPTRHFCLTGRARSSANTTRSMPL